MTKEEFFNKLVVELTYRNSFDFWHNNHLWQKDYPIIHTPPIYISTKHIYITKQNILIPAGQPFEFLNAADYPIEFR